MRTFVRCFAVFLLAFLLQAASSFVFAQSAGNSGTITGTITDPSGAVVPGATVTINNPVSEYTRTATTDDAGHFQLHQCAVQSLPCDRHGHRGSHPSSAMWMSVLPCPRT